MPAAKSKRRSVAANKENQSAAAAAQRLSLSLSPAAKSSSRLSVSSTAAPLTPSAATNTSSPARSSAAHSASFSSSSSSSSPVKSLLLPSPEKRVRHSTAPSLSGAINQSENIRVVVRIRATSCPAAELCVAVPAANTVHIRRDREGELREYSAQFDHVYGPETDTAAIFNESCCGLITALVSGYNASILAYGQTSSGKTFTMMGNVTDTAAGRQQLHGIIPRCMEMVFASIATETLNFNAQQREAAEEDELQQRQLASPCPSFPSASAPLPAASTVSYAVAISFFECYNERVYDLLSPLPLRHPLDVRENAEHGVHIPELQRRIITSAREAVDWIERGNDTRRVAATAHNVVSSRSHAVIQVVVERKVTGGAGGGCVVSSRLDLVDLAGSERYDARTHGLDSRDGRTAVHEMSAINRSLNNLALVVTALTSQSRHVPYRNSVLTHLLKDSLGGSAKCQLIACVNPTAQCAYESMNTLKYASRAKMIKNGVRKAEERGEAAEGDGGVMRGLHAEIERLRRDKVAEKKKRRFFISSMTGVVRRMADVCEEDDGAELPVDDVSSDDGRDDADTADGQLQDEAEQSSRQQQQAVEISGIVEEKVVAACPTSAFAVSASRRHSSSASSERLSVRFQDELDCTSDLTLNGTLNGTLDASCILNSSAAQPGRSRRYQFSDLFSTPHQRKPKRRYRFSVCDTLQAQADPSAASAASCSSSPSSAPIDIACPPSTPHSGSHLFSPATAALLQDFDAGMGRLYAVVRRKERRDELKRESVLEAVREQEAEREAVRLEYEQEMQSKGREMQSMHSRLQQLEQQGAGREEELLSLRAELEAKAGEMQSLQAEYEQAMEDRDERIAQRDAVIASLQQRAEEMELNRQQLLQRIAQLEQDIAQRDDEKQQLEQQLQLLTDQSESRQQQLLQAMADYDARRAADETALAEQRGIAEETRRRMAEVTAEASSIRQQLQQLQSTHRDEQQHSAALSQQLQDRAQQLQALESLLADSRAQSSLLAEQAVAAARQQAEAVQRLQATGAALVGELKEEHELVVSSLMAEYEQSKRQSAQAVQQQAALTQRLTARIDALQQQLTDAQQEAERATCSLLSQQQATETLRQSLLDGQQEIEAVQQSLSFLTAEHQRGLARHQQELEQQLQEAEAARLAAQRQHELQLTSALSDSELKQKTAEDLSLHLALEVTDLQSRLMDGNAEAAKLSERLAAADWREDVKEEELNDLRRLLQDKTAQLSALTQQIAQQQQQMQESREQAAALTLQHQLTVQQLEERSAALQSQHEQAVTQLQAEHLRQQEKLTAAHHSELEKLEQRAAILSCQAAGEQSSQEAAVASLSAQLEKKAAELSALQQQLTSSQRHSSSLLQSLTALKASHHSSLMQAEAELSRLSAASRRLEEEREAARADGEEKTLRLSALELENARVQEVLRRLRGLYERSLKAGSERDKGERQRAEQQAEYESRLQAVTEQVQSMQDVAAQYEDELQDRLSAIEHRERMIELLQQEMHNTEQSRRELSAHILELQQQLTDSEEGSHALEARLLQLTSTSDEREAQLCAQLSVRQQRIDELSTEAELLRDRLRQTEQAAAQAASEHGEQLCEKEQETAEQR